MPLAEAIGSDRSLRCVRYGFGTGCSSSGCLLHLDLYDRPASRRALLSADPSDDVRREEASRRHDWRSPLDRFITNLDVEGLKRALCLAHQEIERLACPSNLVIQSVH